MSRVSIATNLGKPWAFTDRHAELAHSLHYDDLAQLGEVPWQVMGQRYWSAFAEERQAEFLVHDFFPWSAVLEVATMTAAVAQRVHLALNGAPAPSNCERALGVVLLRSR